MSDSFAISPSARLRRSPFYESTLAEGACAVTVYNRMLMPTSYGDPEAEYWRIVNGVSMWDVAVERQVRIEGPDAARLVQALAPRDLSACEPGEGRYVPICDHDGTLLNDPVLLKRAEDSFWLSIADGDAMHWAFAIARERGLDARVDEPDVSPLAVQGPKADDVVASLFGDWTRSLKRFRFRETEIEGIPVAVQRSGWSGQGGFEIYLMDGSRGAQLWNLVKEAGRPWDIGPGNPNWSERIESGLLSYGGDTDDRTNPFEVRLGKFVDLDVPDDTVGIAALRRIAEEGPKRRQLGAVLDEGPPAKPEYAWAPVEMDGRRIGDLTNCAWSYRMERNIGFALVSANARPGDRVVVHRDSGPVSAELRELPFL